MAVSVREWIHKAAVAALLGSSIYYLAALLYIVAARIGYPFSLEWLEGGSYLQVQRILTSQPLYARPSIEYVAMIYPPLYYYVAAAAARLSGLSFYPLRLVSLASALGCIALIYMICQHEGTGTVPAVAAGGLFAATYSLCGSWFDIARVDMLAVFLVLYSIWLLRRRTRAAHICAGLIFALAVLTKQIHLITLACLVLYFLLFDRWRLLDFGLSFLALFGIAFLLLNRIYAGWFKFFVIGLAVGSGEYVSFSPSTSLETALGFWWNSLLLVLPIAALLIVAYLLVNLRRKTNIATWSFYAACTLGMIGTSWSVIQVGGYKNDLIPAYAVIAVLFGLGVHEVSHIPGLNQSHRGAVYALCVIQLLLLRYPIAPQIPSQADLAAGQALVSEIRGQPGFVYVPFHPELALMAGKQPFASWSPMYQLEGNFGGGNVKEAARVKTQFANAMSRQAFDLIILDQTPNWIWGSPEKYYSASSEPVFADPDVFWPVTGWETRPTIRMVPTAK